MLHSTIPGRFVRTAVVGAALFGAAWTLPAIAISNPSEAQYGYDPIVDAGGNEPAQSGSRTPSPDERVQEATKVVDEIASSRAGNPTGSGVSALSEESSQSGGTPTRGREQDPNRIAGDGGRSEGEILRTGPSGQLSSGDDGFSLYSSSWWLIGGLLLLALALATWAFARRNRAGGSGAVDLAVRSVALLAFVVLIIVLNGSGSLLS